MIKIRARSGAAIVPLTVALMIGTIAVGYLLLNRLPHADKSALGGFVAAEGRTPDLHLDWRKITIGKVSFSVPSQLKHTGPPGNKGVIEALAGDDLYVCYSYGRDILSDANRHKDEVKVVVNGRAGRLWIWQPDPLGSKGREESPIMELVVPDIVDGKTTFELYVAGWNLRLLKQVIDSVEIR